MAFAPFSTAYTPEPVRCSAAGARPGAVVLQAWACDESPWGAHLWDVGIFACRDIFGGWCPRCDYDNLSAHASGRAGDSAHNIIDGASHPAGIAFANWLVANHAVLGIQEVISNRRRWTLATGWRAYNGVSPHIDHVHWTLNESGARYLTLARIRSVAPGAPAPTPIPIPHYDEETPMLYKSPGGSVLLLRGEKLVAIHGPTPDADDKAQLANIKRALPPEARNVIPCNASFWNRMKTAYQVVAA